ncbi:hypothetical protein CEXT_782111 [Caerostris extrusa]|uniref:Uncharacterized protein n=1 Tax=Caerostris extrusa TaxID=172846 RepID=A0AAV4WWX7_CAEEX|nr:hypothetical protein CEXT_782111 [Caerostris extrusa]
MKQHFEPKSKKKQVSRIDSSKPSTNELNKGSHSYLNAVRNLHEHNDYFLSEIRKNFKSQHQLVRKMYTAKKKLNSKKLMDLKNMEIKISPLETSR